ncbi:hypothetical protein HanIR_Chr05g0242971 [Helianthus annuus]|nr:hypothetical protein HanIR_Chr05g0242971 [Helianthus annuus]
MLNKLTFTITHSFFLLLHQWRRLPTSIFTQTMNTDTPFLQILDGFDISPSDWNPIRIRASNTIDDHQDNQVNFVFDTVNHRPEQSRVIVDNDLIDSDLRVRVCERGGLGLGFAMEERNYDGDDDDDCGFMVADCGDEFIVSGNGDRSETYFMGGISLVDSDEDPEDHEVIGVEDDFDINVCCDDDIDDDEATLTLCWDAFHLEDDDL